jgi:hypothetical protein
MVAFDQRVSRTRGQGVVYEVLYRTTPYLVKNWGEISKASSGSVEETVGGDSDEQLCSPPLRR